MECRAINGSVAITNNCGIAVPCCITDMSHTTRWDELNIHNIATLDNINSSYLYFQMEDQFAEGQWPQECSQCQKMEFLKKDIAKDGQPQSTRGRLNRQLTQDKKLQRLHIGLDFHCNLSCRSCRPGVSSRWDRLDVSGLEKFDKDHYNDLGTGNYAVAMKRVLENTDLSHLTRVRLSGGEPFLAKNIDWFMNIIPTKQIDFSCNTNGTVLYSLPEFKSVNIELSIDATGDLFESMRYPAKWKKVKENMKRWEEQGPVSINCTLSVMNVNHIQQVLDLGYPTKVYPLFVPDYLRHTQIPLEYRQQWLTDNDHINNTIMFPEEPQSGALEAIKHMDILLNNEFPNKEICHILKSLQ